MSTKSDYHADPSDPFPEDEFETYHSPEPWSQDGRYIRDASGAIVVRGRTAADARRIVAAINATRAIPTDALESWLVQDVSDPVTRPNLEVALDEKPSDSRFAVRPPEEAPFAVALETQTESQIGPGKVPAAAPSGTRARDRRQGQRRAADSAADLQMLVFDRRVMERRLGDRRKAPRNLGF